MGNFWGKKTFTNFAVLWLFIKFSPWNLGAWGPLARHKRAICESFLHKNHIFYQFAKVFSLESFLPYGTLKLTVQMHWFQLKCIVVARILHSLRACPITHVQYHVILYSMEITNLCCNEAFWDSVWKSRIRFVMETKRVWPVLCKYKQWFMVHVQGVCITSMFPWK